MTTAIIITRINPSPSSTSAQPGGIRRYAAASSAGRVHAIRVDMGLADQTVDLLLGPESEGGALRVYGFDAGTLEVGSIGIPSSYR